MKGNKLILAAIAAFTISGSALVQASPEEETTRLVIEANKDVADDIKQELQNAEGVRSISVEADEDSSDA